jgi:poly(3-hydroxybutyrate) depolymerase
MPPLPGQTLQSSISRTYNVYIPDNPPQATVPAIIVFHGGGQDVQTIARHGEVDPAAIPPQAPQPPLDRYLLVFPEADPRLSDEWVNFKGDRAFPTYDILFVDQLLTEIFATTYATGSALVPNVTVDPDLVYAAGFSNGAAFGCWQLMNSDLVSRFKGFAAVGRALSTCWPLRVSGAGLVRMGWRWCRGQAAAGASPVTWFQVVNRVVISCRYWAVVSR